ncbi:MAG: hypothetical protein AB1744_00470, partial [Candidatus Zixiibacteriota bacterium]
PYLLISYHISHPFFKDGGQFTISFSSGNYNCRQAGVLIVAHQSSKRKPIGILGAMVIRATYR